MLLMGSFVLGSNPTKYTEGEVPPSVLRCAALCRAMPCRKTHWKGKMLVVGGLPSSTSRVCSSSSSIAA